MAVTVSDFVITFTTDAFVWDNEKRPNIPIVHWPDGRICQPLLFYFAQAHADNRLSLKSLETIAYTLREWLCFLDNRGKSWFQGSNKLMRQWRQFQRDSTDDIGNGQIENKLTRVLDFYRRIPDAMMFDEYGKRIPTYVGPRGQRSGTWPITTRIDIIKNRPLVVWSGHEIVKRASPAFTALTRPQVMRVLDSLRTPAAQSRNQLGSIRSDRNFLIGDIASGGGLRAFEIADLTTTEITTAIRNEGILYSLPVKYHKMTSVVDLIDDSIAQEIVSDGLYKLLSTHRQYIFININGKGSKPRKAAFFIQTVINILEIGIWKVRAQTIAYWRNCGQVPALTDNVFLSLKSAKEINLESKSISAILAQGFKDARVPGSGHDLRKHYGTRLAISILRRILKNVGYYTDAVLNTVMDEVADALGHEHVTTTTKHYVHLANVYFKVLDQRLKQRRVRKLEIVLDSREEDLSDNAVNLLVNVTQAIADQGENSLVFQLFEKILNDPLVNKSVVEKVQARPDLRLISSRPKAKDD